MSSKKEQRTTAKRKFTLERKTLMNAITQNHNINLIKNSYKSLCTVWENVKERHDEYLRSLNVDTDSEEHDLWVEELSTKFTEAVDKYYNHITEIEMANEEKSNEEKRSHVDKVIKLKTEGSLKKLRFTGSSHMLHDLLVSEKKAGSAEIVKEARDELKFAADAVILAHETYISSIDADEAINEMEWITEVQENFRKLNLRYIESLADVETKTKEPVKRDSLKLERMQLPRFSGELRDYIRFKEDFVKFVIPEVEASKAAFVLKSCLESEPYKYVKNIDNSIKKVWERLDERYGQPSKIAELIVNEIKRYRDLNDNDDKGLMEFIETLEDDYLDMQIVGMESEISSLSMVSLIEEKLPNTVKRKWTEDISKDDSHVDRRNPFPSLLKFLQQQRRIIEYVSADLRTQKKDQKQKKDQNKDRENSSQKKCWVHNSNGHSISCTAYLSESDAERVAFLKEN